MTCFFENKPVREIIDCESALHRVLDIPVIVVGAFNTKMLADFGNPINCKAN